MFCLLTVCFLAFIPAAVDAGVAFRTKDFKYANDYAYEYAPAALHTPPVASYVSGEVVAGVDPYNYNQAIEHGYEEYGYDQHHALGRERVYNKDYYLFRRPSYGYDVRPYATYEARTGYGYGYDGQGYEHAHHTVFESYPYKTLHKH